MPHFSRVHRCQDLVKVGSAGQVNLSTHFHDFSISCSIQISWLINCAQIAMALSFATRSRHIQGKFRFEHVM